MIRSLLSRLARRAGRSAARDGGGASVEFVIVFPIFMILFFSSFEASMLTVRHMMLERAIDLTVRDMRLTTGANWQHGDIVRRVCRNARVLNDCNERLVLELVQIDETSYALPSAAQPCVDTVQDVTPTTTWTITTEQVLTLMRACYAVDPFLPGVGLGFILIRDTDEDGDGIGDSDTLRMVASTVFVQEPRDD